MFLLV